MFFKLYEKTVFFSKFSHISETWDKSGPNIGILVSNGMSKKVSLNINLCVVIKIPCHFKIQ